MNARRRDFLKATAAATAAGPTLLLPRRTLGRSAANDRITMALIGCGSMGRGNLNGFIGQPDVQVLAVCDPDRSRREQTKQDVEKRYAAQTRDGTYKGCAAYNDYRELLARDDIDAVIQATPDHWHAPIVVDAARAGKDCYGEKPLSLTIRQGRIMSDAVARAGAVFQTGSQQRSDGRFRFACELVRNGRIGTVRRVTCGLPTGSTTGNHPPKDVPEGFDYDMWLGPAPWAPYCDKRTHWDFRWILDYSGGQLTDWGAHHIDIAHWGLGLQNTGPVEVEGAGSYPTDGLWDAATSYTFVAKYATGVEITVTNDFENGVRWEGDDGWVFVNRGRIDAHPKELLRERIAPHEVRYAAAPGGHRRDFLDCVRSRRDPIAPIEQAHRTITVAHIGNIAMKLGRKVRWNPDREAFVDDATANRMRDRAMREPWSLLTALVAAVLIALSPARAADPGSDLDGAFAAAAAFQTGQSRAALSEIESAVFASVDDESKRAAMEGRLIALLETGTTTREGKAFACRQLAIIGTKKCVPALAGLLGDEELSHMARYALEVIPDPEAAEALPRRPGVDAPDMVSRAEADAARAEHAGEPDTAAMLYRRVYENAERMGLGRHRSAAALLAVSRIRGKDAVDIVLPRLSDDDPYWRGTAARAVREAPGSDTTLAYAKMLRQLDGAAQVGLIDALAERGDRAAAQPVADLIDVTAGDAREAAIRALGDIGSHDHVPLLVSLACEGDPVALASVERLDAPGTNRKIAEWIPGAPAHVKVVMLQLLETRRAFEHVDTVLELTDQFEDPHVRTTAFLVLARLEGDPRRMKQAMEAAVSPPAKREVLHAVATHGAYHDIAFVRGWLGDEAVGAETAAVIVDLARAAPRAQVEEAARLVDEAADAYPDDASLRSRADDAIVHLQRFEGFIVDWAVSGPFLREGVGGQALFDVAFVPESDPDRASPLWRNVPDDAIVDDRIVDLKKLLGGDDRVAYLKAVIVSQRAQPARFEIGSDDGVKVWLNGEEIHANDVMRGLSIGQDTAGGSLIEGSNVLVMKITQGGGDWRGCCRVRAPDGGRLEAARIVIPR